MENGTTAIEPLPFTVEHELPGWALYWALLEPGEADAEAVSELRARTVARAGDRFRIDTLAQQPTVAELRKLFRAAGSDPTRYRPSSEALLRRILKGGELPTILPLVDLNNCLSAELAAPCCVMEERVLAPPFTLRAGRGGETYESLRGPFRLEGRPLLVDAEGPCDTPITGSQRVKVTAAAERAWLVVYLPAAVRQPEDAHSILAELLAQAPVASVLAAGASG